jgi:hypothetical protein
MIFTVRALHKDDGEAVIFDVTARAHVYGRPAGAWAFEAIAAKAGGLASAQNRNKSEFTSAAVIPTSTIEFCP